MAADQQGAVELADRAYVPGNGIVAVVPGIAAAADAAGGSRAMTDEFGGRKAMTDAVEGRRVIASNIRELQALPCLCEPDTFGAQN